MRIKHLLLLFIFSIFSLSYMVASGSKEYDFSEIDKLIEEKDYNVALQKLEEYIRENPEDFDAAQVRIRKIITARAEYNNVADELIDVIVEEPTEDKKKLQMIDNLENMEKNPNKQTKQFLKETKAAAQFTFFRARFEEIMTEGSRLVANAEYTNAADIFCTGFELYKEDFYENVTDQTLVNNVNKGLQDINNLVSSYKTWQSNMDALLKDYVKAIEVYDLSLAQNLFYQISNKMTSLAQLRNSAADIGWTFQEYFALLKEENPELTEASFLPFAYRFILGRSTDEKTGIIGAMDYQWNYIVNTMKTSSYNAMTKLWEENKSFATPETALSPKTPLKPVKTLLQNEMSLSSLSISSNDFYTLLKTSKDTFIENPYPEYKEGMELLSGLAYNFNSEIDVLEEYHSVLAQMEMYSTPESSYEDMKSGNGEVELFFKDVQSTLSYIDVSTKQVENDTKEKQKNYRNENEITVKEPSKQIIDICDAILVDADEKSRSFWDNYATYLGKGCVEVANRYTDALSNSENLYKGVVNEETGLTMYYPTEAMEEMEKVLIDLVMDKELLEVQKGNLSNIPDNFSKSATYKQSSKEIDESIAKLEDIIVQGEKLISKSRDQLVSAKRAKQEAELRYSQAQAALKRGDYQEARELLERASEKYKQSLDLQESKELRSESDRLIASLGESINKEENEIVLKEVRQLKTSGKKEYYNGNFERSEQIFIKAKNRWAVTNIEEDKEITQWLSQVGMALSMKSGRTIPVTAPLYPEMSQILNISKQLYEQGESLMKQNRKQEAINVLNAALDKLKELQLVYPINQDASILTLRIRQLIDPAGFQELFRQKYQAIQSDYKNPAKAQYAYADLLDLYEINPNYPGIKDFLYTVEIALGVKVPPPDQSKVIESNRRTSRARTLYASGDEASLRAALSELDVAISLNPDNDEAVLLKDKIQSRIGVRTTAVLSSQSEALYQKAVKALQNNNPIEAASIVAQLMQKKEAQRSSKCIELQKRVKIQLGQ